MPSRIRLTGVVSFGAAMLLSFGWLAAAPSSAVTPQAPCPAAATPLPARVPGSTVELPRTDLPQQMPSCQGLSGRTLAISSDRPVHIGLKTYPETLDLHDHEVVLTFDDGPSSATTPLVLDALRQECVKATFFTIGRNAAANPSLVKRELAEGHTLGHHTMTHPAVTLRGLDEPAAEAEMSKGIAADEQAAYGAVAANGPRVPFFRFPGFADTQALLHDLDTKHIAVFSTDLWAADWLPMSPDVEREQVMKRLERSPHHAGIILFHDTKRSTAAMLPALLRELRGKGYKVVHLVPAGQGGEPAKFVEASKGWSSETEAIIEHLWPKISAAGHRATGQHPEQASRLAKVNGASQRIRHAAHANSWRS